MHMYKNIILPLQNDMREKKYQETFMVELQQGNAGRSKKIMPIFHFFNNKISDENKYIEADDFEVIHNSK